MLRAGPRSSRGGAPTCATSPRGQACADGLARRVIAILWNPDGAFAEHLAGYLMPHGMLAADQQWTGDDAALDRYRLGTKASPIPITWYKPRAPIPTSGWRAARSRPWNRGSRWRTGKTRSASATTTGPDLLKDPVAALMKTPHSQNRSKQVELNGVLSGRAWKSR